MIAFMLYINAHYTIAGNHEAVMGQLPPTLEKKFNVNIEHILFILDLIIVTLYRL